jgi:cobalt-zinc-cadmium efflux system membrane fusion protein
MTTTRTRIEGAALALALALALAPAACEKGHADEMPPQGPVGAVGDGDFVRYDSTRAPLEFMKVEAVAVSTTAPPVLLPAKVTFDEDHTQRVASPIDGRAVAIRVKPGDVVRPGQPLLTLSSPVVGQLQADAQKALSDLGVAKGSVNRVHQLQADRAVAEKEVAQAESDHLKARSDYERAHAQLRALGVSPTDPAVDVALRAQIAGTVVDRSVLVGQEVRADQATPLITVSDLDTVWVVADAYESSLGLVRRGDDVTIRVAAYPGEVFPARVTNVSEVIDPATRTAKIRCAAANPGHRLKPEMFAEIAVRGAPARGGAITVPSGAILREGDRSMVVVASEGNVFRLRRIDVGPETDGRVRVVAGLTPGEKIVTTGAIFMRREVQSP